MRRFLMSAIVCLACTGGTWPMGDDYQVVGKTVLTWYPYDRNVVFRNMGPVPLNCGRVTVPLPSMYEGRVLAPYEGGYGFGTYLLLPVEVLKKEGLHCMAMDAPDNKPVVIIEPDEDVSHTNK